MSDIFTKQKRETLEIEEATQEQKKRDRIFMMYIFGILGIFAIFVAYIFYLLQQPGTVLEINNTPVPVRPTKIDQDQYIILHYDYCKHSNAQGLVTSSLVSKTSKVLLPDATDKTEKACKAFDAPVPVPGQTPTGTYHYEFEACYQLNPLKESCTQWESQEFMIKGDEPEKNIEITNP